MKNKLRIRCPKCGMRTFEGVITLRKNCYYMNGNLYVSLFDNIIKIESVLCVCKCGKEWYMKDKDIEDIEKNWKDKIKLTS